jgi:hypothetical protein
MEQQHSENGPLGAGSGPRITRARKTSAQEHFLQLRDEDKQRSVLIERFNGSAISIQESMSRERQLEINKNVNRRNPNNNNGVKCDCRRRVKEYCLEDGKINIDSNLTI